MIEFKSIVDKLFYDNKGQILVSAIFGLALALMFTRVCKDNCIIYYAPKPEEVINKTFKIEDTCYKYKIQPAKCNEKPLVNYDVNQKPENKLEENNFISNMFK